MKAHTHSIYIENDADPFELEEGIVMRIVMEMREIGGDEAGSGKSIVDVIVIFCRR